LIIIIDIAFNFFGFYQYIKLTVFGIVFEYFSLFGKIKTVVKIGIAIAIGFVLSFPRHPVPICKKDAPRDQRGDGEGGDYY
jgi:hypothetical protein